MAERLKPELLSSSDGSLMRFTGSPLFGYRFTEFESQQLRKVAASEQQLLHLVNGYWGDRPIGKTPASHVGNSSSILDRSTDVPTGSSSNGKMLCWLH